MSALEIHPRPSLPQASPHLMPFHIAHDGTAPFSTYFHPKPAPPKLGADGQHEHPPRERTSASFRGRAIEGVKVPLPDGYTGIVVQGESGSGKTAQSKEEAAKEAKKKALKDEKRGKGRRAKARVVEDEDEDEMLVDGAAVEQDDAPPARPLVPTGTFDSFVLWAADHPVDDAMDEYVKGMNEWTRLAAELHKPLPI